MMSELLDSMVIPGVQGGPLMHVIAAKAVAFKEALEEDFKVYAEQVIKNAQAFAKKLMLHDFKVISGGTDNHLMLVDLTHTGFSGRKAEAALGRAGIVVNHNLIPYDPRPQTATSGIRLGTPSVSSRGFGPEQMKFIASSIVKVLGNIEDTTIQERTNEEVKDLCLRFPVSGLEC